MLLSIFSQQYYNECLFQVVKVLQRQKVCFISLNKTSSSLEKAFKIHHLSTNDFFFIDAVSQGLGQEKEADNVVFVSSPAALTELGIAITESLKSGYFDAVVLDSLSTLEIYKLGARADKFVSYVTGKIRAGEESGMLTCLEEDMGSPIVKNASLYVDKAIRFTQLQQRAEKKKTAIKAVAGVVLLALLSMSFFVSPLSTFNQATGFSILSSGLTKVDPIFISSAISMFLALVAASLFVHKNRRIATVAVGRLLQIRPTKRSAATVKKNVRSKLNKWFKGT